MVPERLRRAEVPAAAARRRRRLVLRQGRELRTVQRQRRQPLQRASASPPASRCSPSSASSAPRSPPAGSRTRGATSAAPRSSAPPPARCCTSRSPPWSWAWWRTARCRATARRSSTPSRRCSVTPPGWASWSPATAVVSGLGALNGWTLVTAEMPWAAAKDGLFMPQFAKTYRDGTPWFGILVSTVVASALMALRLQRQHRAEGLHLPRRPVGGHRRDPVLLLGVRAAGLPGLAAPRR